MKWKNITDLNIYKGSLCLDIIVNIIEFSFYILCAYLFETNYEYLVSSVHDKCKKKLMIPKVHSIQVP